MPVPGPSEHGKTWVLCGAWNPVTDQPQRLLTDADGKLQVAMAAGAAGLTDAELRASPVPVTGGGGGVEYTEGDADASITGSAVMWEDAADTLRPVSAAKPLPVSGPLTDAQLRAVAVPVSGTVAATGPLTDAQLRAADVLVSLGGEQVALDATTLAALETIGLDAATLAALETISISGSVAVTGTFWQATQPVSGTFWQGTQPVSGTFWQATQPVSGPLTDAQLRATPVPVSGTVAATLSEPISVDDNGGSITVDAVDLDIRNLSGAQDNVDLRGAFGKTIVRAVIAQGGAGTTELAAASPGNKHKVIAYDFTLSADGTVKFSDGTVDLTGAYDIIAKGGKVNDAAAGGVFLPWFETAAVNRPLQIVTTGGAAKGVIIFVTEA